MHTNQMQRSRESTGQFIQSLSLPCASATGATGADSSPPLCPATALCHPPCGWWDGQSCVPVSHRSPAARGRHGGATAGADPGAAEQPWYSQGFAPCCPGFVHLDGLNPWEVLPEDQTILSPIPFITNSHLLPLSDSHTFLVCSR